MKDLVIIASGPSLTRDDCVRVQGAGHRIMGINNAYQICDDLDYLYGCDRDWWQKHEGVQDFKCKKFSLEPSGFEDVTAMENDGFDGLSFEWPKLRTGGNSGYQAINLAVLLGYRRIILLGYDMQQTNGKNHWHGDHVGMNNPGPDNFKRWIGAYDSLAVLVRGLGIDVMNATRETALTCFKKVALEDVA